MMEQENNPDTGAPAEQSKVATVGQQLREARERQGLSVDDVVAKIKLAHRQIVALEADDFEALPETAFLRGFVRSYAKMLQIDSQPLLDALPGAKVEQPVQADPLHVESPLPSERTARRQNLNLLIAALLIALVIAGFAVWQANAPIPEVAQKPQVSDEAVVEMPLAMPEHVEMLDGTSSVPESGVQAASAVPAEQTAASAVPAVASAAIPGAKMPVASTPVASTVTPVTSTVTPVASAVPPVSPVANSTLRLVFDKEAWVEIRDRNGKLLSNHLNQGGTELRIDGAAPFSLVVGHAPSVHLYYRNKPVDMTPYVNATSEVARLTLE